MEYNPPKIASPFLDRKLYWKKRGAGGGKEHINILSYEEKIL